MRAPANPTARPSTTGAASADCRKDCRSWPDLFRPSTCCYRRQFRHDRVKPGHAAFLWSRTEPHRMPDKLPRIAVIGTGGTISSLGASSMDVLDYPDFGQKLTSEALIERFPETRLVAEPVPVTFRQVGSTAIGPAEWFELRDLIHRITREDAGIAGFVIPHGTATLEETAFFLNLTLAVAQPVVLVGAQRPASALGTDAGTNLVNALQVAGSAEARGKGVLVVLNNEIHPARHVFQTS